MFDIKTRIRKAAEKTTSKEAAKLYESLLQLNIEDKSIQKLLVEKMCEIKLSKSDKAFFENEERLLSVENMGILETLNKITETEIYKTPAIRYNVDAFRREILFDKKPEFMLAESFLTTFKPYLWDETIQKSHAGVEIKVKALDEEISVSKAIYELRHFRNNAIFDGVITKLTYYLQNELGNTGSRNRLIEELGQYHWDPVVVRITNELKNAQSKENGSFQIANAQNGDAVVENVYSPVLVESVGDIFYTGKQFFIIEGETISTISRDEVVAIDESFAELCEFVNTPNVKIKHNEVHIYSGDNKMVFSIAEGEKTIHYNGKQVSMESLTALFAKSAFRVEEGKLIGTLNKLWESLDTILDIEFAKKIKSKVHEGVEVNIFKYNDTIYLNKVNPVMNENVVLENLTGKQTQQMVLEFMNYDISESLTEMLDREDQNTKKIEGKIKEVLEGINQLETQKAKIEAAMNDDMIKESKEVKILYNTINLELKKSKAIYNKLNHMLTENEQVNETSLGKKIGAKFAKAISKASGSAKTKSEYRRVRTAYAKAAYNNNRRVDFRDGDAHIRNLTRDKDATFIATGIAGAAGLSYGAMLAMIKVKIRNNRAKLATATPTERKEIQARIDRLNERFRKLTLQKKK